MLYLSVQVHMCMAWVRKGIDLEKLGETHSFSCRVSCVGVGVALHCIYVHVRICVAPHSWNRDERPIISWVHFTRSCGPYVVGLHLIVK